MRIFVVDIYHIRDMTYATVSFIFHFLSIKVEYNLGVLIQVVNELVLRLDLTSILIVSECIWFACDLDR